ncbi:hypothetical protein B7H23_08845 [Notoacmeibacter marinus]|uniref:Uncharacterized protein n=1 Tax=Notoacmeibacter marinus TaxID=1876515 RepID=A0A231UWR7_9HYPH|nr:hypothetical protein B7H23_08845 [Notoacmeibacter marinus]
MAIIDNIQRYQGIIRPADPYFDMAPIPPFESVLHTICDQFRGDQTDRHRLRAVQHDVVCTPIGPHVIRNTRRSARGFDHIRHHAVQKVLQRDALPMRIVQRTLNLADQLQPADGFVHDLHGVLIVDLALLHLHHRSDDLQIVRYAVLQFAEHEFAASGQFGASPPFFRQPVQGSAHDMDDGDVDDDNEDVEAERQR